MTSRGQHWAKLTPPDVRAIRRKYDEGIAAGQSVHSVVRSIGAEYGLAPTTIYYVGIRRTWKDVSDDETTTEPGETPVQVPDLPR